MFVQSVRAIIILTEYAEFAKKFGGRYDRF